MTTTEQKPLKGVIEKRLFACVAPFGGFLGSMPAFPGLRPGLYSSASFRGLAKLDRFVNFAASKWI